MMKCDPRAFAKCPYRAQCGDSPKHAEFAEGSECDDFNRDILNAPLTNAERIRTMNDKELATTIKDMMFSDFKPACEKSTFFSEDEQPSCEKDCLSCILDWLHQPAEEDK